MRPVARRAIALPAPRALGLVVADAVPLELVVQRHPRDPEAARRLAAVSARAAEGLEDEPSLVRLHALLQRQRPALARLVRPGEEREIEPLRRGEHHEPLDGVLELPYVPGPGVAGEAVQQGVV